MKHFVFALCALVAPSATTAGVHPGAEAGASWVWLSDHDSAGDRDPGGRVDFNAALTLNFRGGDTWGLTTGIRYSRLGNAVNYRDVFPEDTRSETPGAITLTYQYLGLPLLARFHDEDGAGPFVFGGSELAYLLNCDTTLQFEGTDATDDISVTDSMNRFNVTLVAGLGFGFAFGDLGVDLSVRYAHGLLNTVKDEFEVDWKTRELGVTLSIRADPAPGVTRADVSRRTSSH